jgi:hypothetical protein
MLHRRHRNRGFFQMSNKAILDPALSLEAKGFLALMMSRPEDWDYKFEWLEKQSSNGTKAHRTVLRELENAGYVVRGVSVDKLGRVKECEYIVDDEPMDADQVLAEFGLRRAPFLSQRNIPTSPKGSSRGLRGSHKSLLSQKGQVGLSIITNTDSTNTENPCCDDKKPSSQRATDTAQNPMGNSSESKNQNPPREEKSETPKIPEIFPLEEFSMENPDKPTEGAEPEKTLDVFGQIAKRARGAAKKPPAPAKKRDELKSKTPRQRDELMDALMMGWQGTLEVPKPTWGRAAQAAKALREFEVTAKEVENMIKIMRLEWKWSQQMTTPQTVVNNVGSLLKRVRATAALTQTEFVPFEHTLPDGRVVLITGGTEDGIGL